MAVAAGHRLHDLRGGATLVTASMPARASASLVLLFGVGSRYEDARVSGISHFIEHLVFKGTERRPTAKEIAEAIEGVGGMINASTDKEATAYWARVPAERMELALDVLFDMVCEPRLAEDDIERERLVILEEIKMYQDQPQDYVHSLFEELLFPGHPLGRDITGTLETVAAIGRDDLRGYLARHYLAANLVVGVTGGIDEDHARQLVSGMLRLPATEAAGSALDEPAPLRDPAIRLHRKDTEQAHVCLGTRAISYLDPDRYILDLINTMLGEGMSSRLFLEIRESRGLAYDVHSYTSKHRDDGYFAVYMGVDPKKAEQALAAGVAELRRIAEQPVPAAELEKAKEFTKGRLRLGLESTNAMASWLSQQQLLTGVIRTVEEVIAEVDRIDAAQIQRVAQRVLGGPLQVAVIGPFKTDRGFRAAIES
jgi:predicted Zn-dependent peptidase